MTNLGSARQEMTSRAAPQHRFIVANMFGPVDWDYDLLVEEAVKSKADFLDANDEHADEAEWDLVSGAPEEPYSRGRNPMPSSKVAKEKSSKSSFDRGSPLCEANMFGPLDWAFELIGKNGVPGSGTAE